MESTKTTFYLDNQLRRQLKAVGIQQGKSVTDLLAEGAELVLARYQRRMDRDELVRRARVAWDRMREGLYSGPSVLGHEDQLLYAEEPKPRLKKE